jgi:hypothetical protein
MASIFRRGILIPWGKLLLSIPYGGRVCSRFGIFTSSRRSTTLFGICYLLGALVNHMFLTARIWMAVSISSIV